MQAASWECLIAFIKGRCCFPIITDEETEAQRDKGLTQCLRVSLTCATPQSLYFLLCIHPGVEGGSLESDMKEDSCGAQLGHGCATENWLGLC